MRKFRFSIKANEIGNVSLYRSLLTHLAAHSLHRQGKQLHAHFIISSITPDNLFASKFIHLYSLTNNLPQAHSLFNQIPHKNIYSFNNLFSSYLRNHRFSQALSLFSSSFTSSSFKPNTCTISCLLKLLSSFPSPFSPTYSCKQTHAFALRNILSDDIFVGNGLISLYSKCGRFDLARTVFDSMKVKDIVSWNSIISGFSHGGLHRECKELYTQLVCSYSCSGLNPNAMTITAVLHSCAQSKDVVMGMEIHRSLSLYLKEVDILTGNSLVDFYAKCGDLSQAKVVLERMRVKDDVSYCSLISGYMLHGFVEQAVDVFKGLNNPGLNVWNSVISGLFQNKFYDETLCFLHFMKECGMKYNSVTLCIIIPLFSHLLNVKGCKTAHGYAVRNNYDSGAYFVSVTIDAYSKLGFLQGSQFIFSKSKQRSLVIWTAMIAALASHGRACSAISHFYEMLRTGTRPDSVAFVAVLSACAHSGMVDTAFRIFESMEAAFGVEPSLEHYACMIVVLTRAGRLGDASEFMSTLPVKPSAEMWGSLLDAALVTNDTALGRSIFDRLYEMDPGNCGNFVIMSKLYSQAERWDYADKVREKMRKIDVRKSSGISLVETGEMIHP